ncbi:hypothetical protein EI42_03314 [Thermosporothrix hazakensis]|jgi:hypothetical protein|uniref:Uncharacterized protein n=2 Tax=Thermosporothrix TaxID=768650 RepID=A0A326U8J0_THEHA|nr:hypothetical protein [Thermosporothrix hazakensis]PZW27936.1 hypothetical protein EI42_03314 [Thermosporothrix hazakensis]BBH86864.1 hypothetical protein KTC_16150 [Thermosporothrix sp. COM3]GCE51160.1 hypothetical protein KTH_60290 [Thermosporothrix hazakensis]
MRLVSEGQRIIARFTVPWEIAFLAEQGNVWIGLHRPGEKDPLGAIHAQTHEVRLWQNTIERQVVVLGAPLSLPD